MHTTDKHRIQIKTDHCQDHKEHQYNDVFYTAQNALVDKEAHNQTTDATV